MSTPPRYAIYFIPAPDSALYRFGSSVLGYDCYSGMDVDRPSDAGLPEDWAELTIEPQRYGFHGTLKAPFRLSPDYDEAALLHAFAAFASQAREIATIEPVVRALGRFIAVVPRHRSAATEQLAAGCVRYFDAFRAPMSAAERARREASGLSERERSNLDRWGYPYVFEEFRFHMTLSGPVDDDRRSATGYLLSTLLQRCRGTDTVEIGRVALVRQEHAGARFHVLRDALLAQGAGSSAFMTGASGAQSESSTCR